MHDAAVIPVEWAPQWQHRFRRFAKARRERMDGRCGRESLGRVCGRVRRRIEAEGALASADFDDPHHEAGGWWSWKPAKVALEYLWRTGPLAVSSRENFQKRYDLTERFLPDLHGARPVTRRAYVDWACREALDRLVTATPRELAHFWDDVTAPEARIWAEGAVRRGEAIAVEVASANGAKPVRAFAAVDWKERLDRVPPAPEGLRVLAPFDPVLRERERAARLFGFDYRFEAFVPAKKRRDGYYVLPLFRGDRFIGRFDPKLDRATGTLRVRKLQLEPDVRPTKRLASEVDESLDRLRAWLGAERIARD